MPESEKPRSKKSAPISIAVVVNGKPRRLRYDKAFVLACALLEEGHVRDAAKLFVRMEDFVDRGPREFIMQAFCEAAAMRFEKCTEPLSNAFEWVDQKTADASQAAFVSYHVGIRQDALKVMTELCNTHPNLPTLCLLLGDMLQESGNVRPNRHRLCRYKLRPNSSM